MMNNFAQFFTIGLLTIGILAFLVSIVVEVLKGVFNRLPTDILVFLLSIIFTLIAYFAAIGYYKHVIVWYEVVGIIIGGFLVAFVAMYGWSKFSELYFRFKAPKDLTDLGVNKTDTSKESSKSTTDSNKDNK